MKWLIGSLLGLVLILGMLLLVARPGARQADLIFIAGDDLHNLDPQRTSWLVDFRVLTCLYETLIRHRVSDGTLEPGTAERWNISEDGLTYTFHLRDNARWSNGDTVTSRDFVYGWRRALLPDFAADYTTMLFAVEGAEDFFNYRESQLAEYAARPDSEKSAQAARELWDDALAQFDELVQIQTPDDRTLIVRLAQPTAYFLELCAFMTFSPVHEASIAPFVLGPDAVTGMVQQSPAYFTPQNMVGNGTYVMQRRRAKRDLLLVANEHYWDRDSMRNQSVLIKVIPDTINAETTYNRGVADWWPDVPSVDAIAERLKNAGRDDVHSYISCGSYFYIFNCNPTLPSGEKNPFADARVRRALSMAIDRETIVSQVTRLNQPVAHTFVPPGVFAGYEPPVEDGITYDPEGARKLLAEAGYPNGRGMPQRMTLLYNTGAGHGPVAQRLANTWAQELGVHFELDARETLIFGQERKKQNFAVARGNWFGDYRDPTTFLFMYRSGDGNNDAKFASEEYDNLLAAAERELDPARRMKMLQDAERALLREQPIAPIFHYIELELFDPQRIRHVHPNPMKNRRIDLIEVVEAEANHE